ALVFGVLARAEREARDVEGDGEVGGLLLLQQVEQHRDEPVDGVGVLTVARHEAVGRQRIERRERQRMAVDEQERRLIFRHGASLSGGPDTPPTRTTDGALMVILPPDLDPELVARLGESGGGELPRRMGIEFLELSATHSVARMPVEGNRQVVGLLHGGAHGVLGDSLGSNSSAIHAGPGRYAVGIEINATHSRSITEGWVTGTCTALVLGRTLCTHEIVMTDDDGRRLSTVRMTNMLRDRAAD